MHYFELSSDFETFHSRKNNKVPLLQAQLFITGQSGGEFVQEISPWCGVV